MHAYIFMYAYTSTDMPPAKETAASEFGFRLFGKWTCQPATREAGIHTVLLIWWVYSSLSKTIGGDNQVCDSEVRAYLYITRR